MNLFDHTLIVYLAVLACPILLLTAIALLGAIVRRLRLMHQEMIDTHETLKRLKQSR